MYPDHIYDTNRLQLAQTILEKEYRKLFLGLPENMWSQLDGSIRDWAKMPIKYHLEDDGPRDFWDIFAALLESVKLKPNFTAWITADNVQWHRTSVPIRQLQMTSPLDIVNKVPGLVARRDLPFAEYIDALAAHPESLGDQKRIIDAHSTDSAQDAYPVIIRKAADNLYKIMDGNRRTLRAVIYGERTVDAWAAEISGSEPTNFWIPINDMFQLLKTFKDAGDNHDSSLQLAVTTVLRAKFATSEVAKQAYRNRIANQMDIAQQLYDAAIA